MDRKMYVISYCLIFAFHPKLDIDRIVIYRSFQQTQDQLFDLSHLKPKMLQFLDNVALNQLKDAGLKVYLKKSCFALSEMCSVELKFTIDLLVKWLYSIYKMGFLEIDQLAKQTYEKNNRIDWAKTNCCICDLKLPVGFSFGPASEKITYLDFIIKKNIILCNIFDPDILKILAT